jgi:hypothetical protein
MAPQDAPARKPDLTFGFYNTPDDWFCKLLDVYLHEGQTFTEEMVAQWSHILNTELLTPYLETGQFHIVRTRRLLREQIQNIARVEFDYIVESLSPAQYAEEMIDFLPSLGISLRHPHSEDGHFVLLAEEGSNETLIHYMREYELLA